MSHQEIINYDVVIVGAGPSGISTAIHLKQLSKKQNKDISVCLIEKSSDIGSHSISGAVIDTRSLRELLPTHDMDNNKLLTPVLNESLIYLTKNFSFKIPNFLIPDCLSNKNCHLVRLGHLVKFLGKIAEDLGVDIFTGFAAKELIYNEQKEVCGILTGDFGIDKNGHKKNNFQSGLKILASHTILAEGSRGNLGKEVIKKFNLDKHKNSQNYAIGIKEIWEVNDINHIPGRVIHTIGWPLNKNANGGSFIYYLPKNLLSIGMVVDLDYKNTWLSPFDEFQRFKLHKVVKNIIKDGKRISYGARSITSGGLLSLPKISFPGGMLVGCDAGLLNSSRLKGVHSAIKSGMLAAQSIVDTFFSENKAIICYENLFTKSWLHKELYLSRNFKLWNKKNKVIGYMMNFLEQKVLKSLFPYDLKNNKPDHSHLEEKTKSKYINYEKPDNIFTFDKESSVFLSNTHHDKNQPIHLEIIDKEIPVKINLNKYGGPEIRYCPAGVYKFDKDDKNEYCLTIESENCIHCKTCDIKDPNQNIKWNPPQGGEGPIYNGM